MKTIAKVMGIGALCISILSCSGTKNPDNMNPEKSDYEITISGKPLSVAYDFGGPNNQAEISTVINVNERPVLAYGKLSDRKSIDAAALILSEINDGDNESIELFGHYDKDKQFMIKSVNAQGYKVVFSWKNEAE